MKRKTIYRVIFINQQQNVYEIYARSIVPKEMLGFVTIEDIVFGETTNLLVDPAQERLKTEFQGVTRIFIPMHSIVRIDQVEKEGIAKIMPLGPDSNVASLQAHISSKTPKDTY